jgi:uncharacterized protein YjbI with pentapeptide repeats
MYTQIKKYFVKHLKYIIGFLILVFLAIYFMCHPEYLTFKFWGDSKNLNRSETLRNLGLIVIGVLAIIIAVWRAIVASKELSNSNLKINQEKFHKAVELLESEFERNKISALVMLSELLNESKNFDEITFEVLRSYLQEHANVEEEFLKFAEYHQVEEKITKWYSRKTVDYSILLCFENYVKLIEESRVRYGLHHRLFFNNLNLHGLTIKMPNRLIQSCDLSNCTIICSEHTKFRNCDLTGASIIPYNNNTEVFDYCNISYAHIEVENEINPLLNGWHWEGSPPKLCDFCTYISLPQDRRVVLMPRNRILLNAYKNGYYEDEYRTGNPFSLGFGDDKPSGDKEKQQIVSELDYNKSKND